MDLTVKNPSVPTLEDVAREANVSTATVSRCLNSPERVFEKTRERVLAAVSRLGYSPNFGARALAAKRTNTIGAVIPTMENAIFARGLQAFQEVVSENGATLLVASSAYRQDLEEKQIRNLVARGADALLLIGDERDDKLYEFLTNRGIPYVVAWSFRDDKNHCFVGFDNRAAAKEITTKIIEFGHSRIGMIAGLTRNNDRARDRVLGVKDAIIEHGLNVDDLNVIEAEYSFAEGGNAVERLLNLEPRPTAIVCGNDILAVGAMKRARSLGVQIPDQLSITGFDDIEVCSVVEPGLTTIHVPHRNMGKTAAKCLFTMMKNKNICASSYLETYVVERQSLAAPPKP
jgi:LacI family transcriptional regulator